jgi:hypothetical protein
MPRTEHLPPYSPRPRAALGGLAVGALAAVAALRLTACGPGDDTGTGDCAGLLAGDLVITEVMANPSGADEGNQWFEIHNASTAVKDLAGLVVSHGRPDGSSTKTHVMRPVTIDPGQYLVLADTAVDLVPAWGDYGFGRDLGDLFNNDGGKLALMCGPTEIDHATYELVEDGRSRSLDGGRAPDYQVNDDPASWCASDTTAAHEYTTDNFGTPRAANPDCMNIVPGQCDDSGTMRPTVAPVVGDLTITEVMPTPSQPVGSDGEWFEVLVNRDVDLNDLGLDRAGDTSMPNVLSSTRCLRATAGTRLVFARSMDTAANGGLPRVDGLFTFAIVGGSMATPGDVRLTMGATELDKLSWTSSRTGKAIQLNAGLTAPTDNDVAANLCDATATYGTNGDLGTPGAANTACGSTSSGMCLDAGTNMMRAAVSPVAGDLTITEMMPNPAVVSDTVGEWFEVLVNRDVDLNGVGLDRAGDTSNPNVITSATCKRVTAGTYVVFAKSADSAMNGGLPPVQATFTFAMIDGTPATPGDVRLMLGMDVLDSTSWTSARSGKSLQLNAGLEAPADNDVAANFCDGSTFYGGAMDNQGTPGAANLMCQGGGNGMCLDSGTNMMRAIVKPAAGQLTITEWMPNPSLVDDTQGEWFELRASADVDLNGLQAGTTALGMTPIVPASGACVRVSNGAYALIARNAVPASNGMLPMVDGTFGFGLVNSSGQLRIGIDNNVLQMVMWATSVAAKSIMIDSDGTQCNAPAGVASYNGGTDVGTPRAVNTPPECP